LDILAATGVDYCAFFRAISTFCCSDAKYNSSITYQPEGIHSEESLRSYNPPDCLGLLLKSLLALRDEENQYILKKIEKLKKQEGTLNGDGNINAVLDTIDEEGNTQKTKKPFYNPATFPQLQPLPFPTLEEMSVTWKFWTQTFRIRLLGQAKKTPAEITQDDSLRHRQLKNINPKYLPRNYMMNEVFNEIYEKIPHLVEKRSKNQARVGAGKSDSLAFEENIKLATIKNLSKLVLDDLHGGIADSSSGWELNEDTLQAEKWAIPPPLVFNSYIGKIKCLCNAEQTINISIAITFSSCPDKDCFARSMNNQEATLRKIKS
jgi:hypothetical protein